MDMKSSQNLILKNSAQSKIISASKPAFSAPIKYGEIRGFSGMQLIGAPKFVW